MCGSTTGLMNEICLSCDSDKLEIIIYEPQENEHPGFVVTVTKKITTMEEGIAWHYTLLENLEEFNTWYDGHEVEILKAVDAAIMMSSGEFTMYWNFAMEDSVKTVELIGKLYSMRPGFMRNALIEIEFHDTIEYGE
jgi:hypothetical protein